MELSKKDLKDLYTLQIKKVQVFLENLEVRKKEMKTELKNLREKRKNIK